LNTKRQSISPIGVRQSTNDVNQRYAVNNRFQRPFSPEVPARNQVAQSE